MLAVGLSQSSDVHSITTLINKVAAVVYHDKCIFALLILIKFIRIQKKTAFIAFSNKITVIDLRC